VFLMMWLCQVCCWRLRLPCCEQQWPVWSRGYNQFWKIKSAYCICDIQEKGVLQAVSSLSVTMEAWVQSQGCHVEFLVDRVAVGNVFLWMLGFCPVIVILLTLHLYSSATNTKGVATMWVLHITGADCPSCL
jgi:hypothetical protein